MTTAPPTLHSPRTTRRIYLPRPHDGQRQVLACKARFRVLACGRRWGKSETARQAIADAVLHGGFGWWVLPDYPMATEAWRVLKQTFDPVVKDRSEEERRLALITGGVVQVKSAHDPDGLRGLGLDFVVLDEAAFMAEEAWTGGIRPALSDKQGRALFASTPNGHNWFYRLYRMGLDPLQSDWASFHYRTADNPRIPAGEVEAARLDMPERWYRQEYEAEFIEDAGAVFRNLDKACIGHAVAPYPGHFVAGIDWGRESDFTAIAVFDRTKKCMVELDRYRAISWQQQRDRLKALCDRWKPSVVWAENNSIGSPNVEALQREGLPVRPFDTTAKSKTPLIEALALALEREDVTLLDDPVLRGELRAYQLERLPSGLFRYSAPAGEHDDTVIAAALAWHGVMGTQGAAVVFAIGSDETGGGDDW